VLARAWAVDIASSFIARLGRVITHLPNFTRASAFPSPDRTDRVGYS
jgi:hypothetical protein